MKIEAAVAALTVTAMETFALVGAVATADSPLGYCRNSAKRFGQRLGVAKLLANYDIT